MALRARRCPRGAYAALHIFIITYIVYKWVFSLSYIGRVFDTYKPSGLINPTISVVLFRVGLIHTILLRCRWRGLTQDIGSGGARNVARRSHAPWTTGSIKEHVPLIGSYNGRDLIGRYAFRSLDRDPTGEIRCVIITPINGSIWTLHRRSNRRDIFKTVHDGPFHRNRRSFRSDGYDKKPYIKRCSSTIVSIRVGNSIELSCLDTFPLVSLDSIVFLFHFRTSGAFEVKIWWRIEGEIATWTSRSRSSFFRWLRGLITIIWSQSWVSGSGFCFLIFQLGLIFV